MSAKEMRNIKFEFYPVESEDDVVYSSDPFYDLTDGGYLDPYEILKNSDQAEMVQEAAYLISRFLEEARDNGNLGEM